MVGVGCHLEIAVSDVKSADLIGFSLKSHYIVIIETYRRHSSFVITQTSAISQKSKNRKERLFVLLLVLVLQILTIVVRLAVAHTATMRGGTPPAPINTNCWD